MTVVRFRDIVHAYEKSDSDECPHLQALIARFVEATSPTKEIVTKIIRAKPRKRKSFNYLSTEVIVAVYKGLLSKEDCTLVDLLRLYFEGRLAYHQHCWDIFDYEEEIFQTILKRSTFEQWIAGLRYVVSSESPPGMDTSHVFRRIMCPQELPFLKKRVAKMLETLQDAVGTDYLLGPWNEQQWRGLIRVFIILQKK